MKKILVWFGLIGMAIGFQQTPIPPYPGDDDPSHNGQPMFCQNYPTREHLHNCTCMAMGGEDERCKSKSPDQDRDEEGYPLNGPLAKGCSTRCRKNACLCQRRCDT